MESLFEQLGGTYTTIAYPIFDYRPKKNALSVCGDNAD